MNALNQNRYSKHDGGDDNYKKKDDNDKKKDDNERDMNDDENDKDARNEVSIPRADASFPRADASFPCAANSIDPRRYSLFHPVPADRDCDSAGIPATYCRCSAGATTKLQLAVDEDLVLEAANAIVDALNAQLEADAEANVKCAKLKLAKILASYRYVLLHRPCTIRQSVCPAFDFVSYSFRDQDPH